MWAKEEAKETGRHLDKFRGVCCKCGEAGYIPNAIKKFRKWRRQLGKMEEHLELHKEEIEMLESGTMREGKD